MNRKLAGKSLPEGSRIISAVNGGSEYQLTDLDPALVSRFNIYEFAPSIEDWINWARTSKLDSRIIAFIEENPEMLDGDDFAGEENLERSPDRRSWERLSKVIEKFPELGLLHQPMVSGIVGDRAAASFFDFVNNHKVPSVEELLNCQDIEALVSDLSFTDFTKLNEAIFRWLQSQTDKALEIKAENLISYYDYLGKSQRKELQAHFASLVSAERYPAALNFILEKAPLLCG